MKKIYWYYGKFGVRKSFWIRVFTKGIHIKNYRTFSERMNFKKHITFSGWTITVIK